MTQLYKKLMTALPAGDTVALLWEPKQGMVASIPKMVYAMLINALKN